MAEPIDFFGLQKATDESAQRILKETPTLEQLFKPEPGPLNQLNKAPTEPLNINQLFSNTQLKQEAEGGFFNQLASVAAIPQQILYTAGKNLGEEMLGREMGNKRFGEELMDAVEGKSSLTFNDVLKSVDMDMIDFKIPGLEIQNPYVRIPSAVLAGIASGVVTANPAVGIAVGFGLEGAARGRGVPSTLADVFLDPLNKLRLFQASTKATKGMNVAASADSYLTQIAKGERAIFDLEGKLGLGKPIDAFFDAAFKPIDLVGKHAGSLVLNVPGIKWVQKPINAFTGVLDARIAPHLDGLFKRNGAIAHEALGDGADIDEAIDIAFAGDPETAKFIKGLPGTPGEKLRRLVNEKADKASLIKAKAMEPLEDLLQDNFNDENLLKFEGASASRKNGNTREGVVRQVSLEDPNEVVNRMTTEVDTLQNNLRLGDAETQDLVRRNANQETSLRRDVQNKMNDLTQKDLELQRRQARQSPVSASGQRFASRTAKSIKPEEVADIVTSARANGLQIADDEPIVSVLQKLRNLVDDPAVRAGRDAINEERLLYQDQLLQMQGGTAADIVERKTMAELIGTMLGKEALDNTRVFYSDAGAAIRQGTDEANEVAVQMITNFQRGDMNAPTSMFMNIFRAAGSDDAFKLMGGDVFDNLYQKSEGFTNMVHDVFKNVTDVPQLKSSWKDAWYSAAKFGKVQKDLQDQGFFAVVLDGVRSFFRMMERMVQGKNFRSDEVHKKILKFMNDTDYFEELRKTDFNGGEVLLKSVDVSKNELFEQSMAAMKELRAAGYLPAGMGMKPAVNGFVPQKLIENRDSFEDIRNVAYDYGALTSADIAQAGAARQALYSSPQQQQLIGAVTHPRNESFVKQILNDSELKELKQLVNVTEAGAVRYRGDLDSIAQPGTPAWESLQKVRSAYEVKPLDLYQTNLATLHMHVANSLGHAETAGVIKAIDKLSIGTEDELLGRVKSSLISSMDAALLDPTKVNDIARVVRKYEGLAPKARKLDDAAGDLLRKSEKDAEFVIDKRLAETLGRSQLKVGAKTTYPKALKELQTSSLNLNDFVKNAERLIEDDAPAAMDYLLEASQKFNIKLPFGQIPTAETNAQSLLNAVKRRTSAINRSIEGLQKTPRGSLPTTVTKRMVDIADNNKILMGGGKLPVEGKTTTEAFLKELRKRATDPGSQEKGGIVGETLRLMAKQDLTFKELESLQDNLSRFSDALPEAGRMELSRVLSEIPANVADSAVSPTLTRAAAAGRLFDPKTISEQQLNQILKVDEFSVKALKESNEFAQITQEINSKRKGTPQIRSGTQEIPLTEDVLDQRFVTKKEAAEYELKGWKRFNPQGTVPPVMARLAGRMVPKELHRVLSSTEINLGKAFEQTGKLLSGITKGFNDVEASQAIKSTADALEDSTLGKKLMPKGVGEGVRNAGARFLSSTNLNYVTNLFKAQALMSPAYHVRNAVSGVVVNLMHGVSPGAHSDALNHMLRQRAGMATDPKLQGWWDEFVTKGGSGQGRGAEIQRDVAQFQGAVQRPGISANLANPNFGGYRMNFAFGQYVDDMTRFASYVDARKTGKNAVESIDQVKLLHFDYNDLSEFENTVLKKIIPFYTYFRKAVARDGRLFMQRTGNYYKMGHVIQQIERGVEDPEDSTVVAQFVREKLGVPFRRNPSTGAVEYFMLSNWIPAADFTTRFLKDGDVVRPSESFFEFLKESASGISPILKAPIELAMNHDFYFGREISEYEGQESDFWGMAVDKRMVKLLRMIRVFNDVDKLVKTQVDSPTRPDLPREDATAALVNVFGGGKVVANLDPERQLERNVRRPVRDLKRLVGRERRRGPTANTERLGELLQQAQEKATQDELRAASSLGKIKRPGFTGTGALDVLFGGQPNPENLPR